MTRLRQAVTCLFLVPAAVLPLAAPAHAVRTARFDCSWKSASLLFWPKGHGARPRAGFPEYRLPHLEIYGGIHDTTFPSTQPTYMDANGGIAPGDACRARGPQQVQGEVKHAATRRKAKNVQCRVGKKMRLIFSDVKTGSKVDVVHADGKPVAEVRIKRGSGSYVKFDKRVCEAKPPPE